MLLSLRKNAVTSLFKEVRAFKEGKEGQGRDKCQDFHLLLQDPPDPEGFQKGIRRDL